MIEGTLKLKQNTGGFRHYIETELGEEYDLHCGTPVMVQLCRFVDNGHTETVEPGHWMAGRYEGSFYGDKPLALFYFGYAYPAVDSLRCQLPLGTRVQVTW